ncbi:MAG: hypothetical protein J0I23_23755 [Rhizobiales bacterium]|nr:hypothetical protein [Hyphomicrobiales bacterium]
MASTGHSTRRTVLKAGLVLATTGHPAVAGGGFAEAPPDPLVDAIRAYKNGIAAFDAIKEDDWPLHGGEEAVIEKTYAKSLQALQSWHKPALTRQGAVEALRFAHTENKAHCSNPIIMAMLTAALTYFEGESA